VALVAGFGSALVAPRLGKWRVLIPVFPIVYAYSQGLALAHETMQGQHLLMALAVLCAAPGAMLAAYVGTLVVPGAGWRPREDVTSSRAPTGLASEEDRLNEE